MGEPKLVTIFSMTMKNLPFLQESTRYCCCSFQELSPHETQPTSFDDLDVDFVMELVGSLVI